MNGLIYKLNTDNDYVLPKVAHVIHEARDFDMDVIQATVSQSKPIFIVGRDFSSNDLTLGTPYLTGTVVSIERIEKEQHKSKLFVKGLYRAKVSDQLALFAPDN